MTAITLAQLTEKSLTGTGVFDVLLQTLKLHLDTQYKDNRITGPEYATVYLGQVESAMQTGLAFLTQQQRIGLEAELLQQQILLAQEQLLQAKEQTLIAKAQLQLANAQLLQTQAQTALIDKQAANLLSEKAQIEAQTILIDKNAAKTEAETLLVPKQGSQIDAQTALITANKSKTDAESLNVPKQGVLLDAQAALSVQQKANAVVEGTVLVAQECKLRAEFDFVAQNVLKSTAETALVNQKTATEKAQVLAIGVDADSVVGKQKALYTAQADGFKRDAEQKAAKLYVDVWSAQRMTDPDATPASAAHGLSPDYMKLVMDKLRLGIGA